jgi:uncharacterized protein
MFFDPLYWIMMLPALLLAGYATILTKVRFAKYSHVEAASGITGARAAQRLLQTQGVSDVAIEEVGGFLSDHYDPTSKTLRLSPDVYRSTSLSAIGVACHEAGHALQHAAGYAPLGLRSAMVPLAQFGSFGSYIVLMLGFLLGPAAGLGLGLVKLGIILFSVTVLFSIVTLPVEWNASARAKGLMVSSGIVSVSEQEDAAKVLNAAFLTYVASAVSSLMMLLYYLLRSGLLGGRRDD